jgi:hypothetical protein
MMAPEIPLCYKISNMILFLLVVAVAIVLETLTNWSERN